MRIKPGTRILLRATLKFQWRHMEKAELRGNVLSADRSPRSWTGKVEEDPRYLNVFLSPDWRMRFCCSKGPTFQYLAL